LYWDQNFTTFTKSYYKAMKKIEIRTTHNVDIQYELATVFERIAAFIIDLVFIWLSIGILMIFVSVFAGPNTKYGFYIVAVPIFVFYNLLFEVFNNGQSFGKKILKIRVVKIDGEKAGVTDYFLRWCFRWLDIYMSVGTLAILSMSSTQKSQRIGDMLADTTIIKVDPNRRQKLEYIFELQKADNHKVRYPEIVQFSEQDMLVIKETIDRYKKYPNYEHKQAIFMLVEKIKEELGIVPLKNKIEFLKILIKDYVVLTR